MNYSHHLLTGLVASILLLPLSCTPLSAPFPQSNQQNTGDDLGDKGFDKYFGHGRLNLNKTLKHLATGQRNRG